MNLKFVIITGVVIILAIGSVVVADSLVDANLSQELASSPTETEDSIEQNGGRKPKDAEIKISPTALNFSDTYSMTLDVDAEAYGYNNLSYNDLRVCVYDHNGAILYGETIGQFTSATDASNTESYREYSINATTSSRPKYVTVDQPQLRHDGRVAVEILVINDNEESWDDEWSGGVTSHNEKFDNITPFEFPRTNEVGKCG